MTSASPSASRIFTILAGAEAGLSRSSTSRAGSWVTFSLSIQGRGRSPVGGERRQLQRVGLAGSAGSGSAPGAPSRRESGCRVARTGGPPKTSRTARAAFVFLGCPAFAPVRRLRAEVGARPSRRIRVGICRWADGFCRRHGGGGG
jgi:hypothetical protein